MQPPPYPRGGGCFFFPGTEEARGRGPALPNAGMPRPRGFSDRMTRLQVVGLQPPTSNAELAPLAGVATFAEELDQPNAQCPSGPKSALVRLPRLSMPALGPVGVHLAHCAPKGARRRLIGRTAVFGPGVAGQSRQATAEEAQVGREECDRERDDEMGFRTAFRSGALGRAVGHLLDSPSAALQVRPRPRQGWIVHFWRGSHILEVTSISTHARVRIPRDIGPGNQELLALHF